MSNCRLPAKTLATLVLGSRSRDDKARDESTLTTLKTTYSKQKVIYNRQQTVSKTGDIGRNASMQTIAGNLRVKMDGSKKRRRYFYILDVLCDIIVSEMTCGVSMGTLNPTIPYLCDIQPTVQKQ